MAGSEKCVCCGTDIPEGRQICRICELEIDLNSQHKKARWLKDDAGAFCSCCGWAVENTSNYCPDCGARMI